MISRQRFVHSALGLAVVLLLGCAGTPVHLSSGNRDPHGPADVEAHMEWLESPERDAWQKPDQVIAALSIAGDAVVADVGCGPGYFSRRLARAVPRGLVYAVDVEPRQLDRLNERLRRDHIENVIPVLAPLDDPRLPPGRIDLVLVVDTYHHFGDRPAYLARLRRALAPGGRLAILDYHKRELPIGPPLEHKLAREVVLEEARAAGFRLIAEPTVVEYQYFLIFQPQVE
jgi:ubiquinone/menaquinone biosynthesis C-methylase UbiE